MTIHKVRYTREFKYGDRGSDVEGVGRALCHARVFIPLIVFNRLPRIVRRTWGRRKQKALKQFKKTHKLRADFHYGPKAHAALSKHFDAKARKLMRDWEAPHAKQDKQFATLLAAMIKMTADSPGYGYGSGHGEALISISTHDYLDCSSSTSKALHMAGMFPDRYAWDSGKFARSYGKPGRGDYFTVYANSSHVWVRLHKTRWWRFDTSSYGDSRSWKRGPRLRFLPRPTWGFTARHWPGM